jgi:hypothetical protein
MRMREIWRQSRESAIDRLLIWVFFALADHAPLAILRAFQRELDTAIRERFAAQVAAALVEGDERADAR